ncbi:MAG: SLBB domain-containing protein [Gemmataceae bacterium]|nr:SLBB domain-containing protein [Gemmataceae bacterium]
MRRTVRFGGAFALWVIVTAATGCETLGLSPPANQLLPATKAIRNTSPPAPAVPRELAKELQPAYVVEPGDTLLVQPTDLDSPVRLPPDQVVFADGTIDLGVYGRPVVAGRTQEQIVALVSTAISAKEGEKEKLKEPVGVTVRIIGRTSKVYYVLGEVNAPGAFPVNGFDTVLDGIIRAGGVTNRAGLQNIVLSRPTPPDNCRVVFPVCYSNIVQLGDTSTNYQLQPGDRIYVPGKGLFEGLLPARCRPGGPCDKPQVGCFGGGCGAPTAGPPVLTLPR